MQTLPLKHTVSICCCLWCWNIQITWTELDGDFNSGDSTVALIIDTYALEIYTGEYIITFVKANSLKKSTELEFVDVKHDGYKQNAKTAYSWFKEMLTFTYRPVFQKTKNILFSVKQYRGRYFNQKNCNLKRCNRFVWRANSKSNQVKCTESWNCL